MQLTKVVSRSYILTEAFVLEKLGLRGQDIQSIGLWSGKSPHTVSPNNEWEFVTHEYFEGEDDA
jgi:hypothetical protein